MPRRRRSPCARRERDAARRAVADQAFVARFADAIRRRYPGCPPERSQAIAEHAAARGSGRIGRTAAARDLGGTTIVLAVTASVRHRDTDYDAPLMVGVPRAEARARVRAGVAEILRNREAAPAGGSAVRRRSPSAPSRMNP